MLVCYVRKTGCCLFGIKNGFELFLAVPCGPGHLLYLLFQKDATPVPDSAVCKIGMLLSNFFLGSKLRLISELLSLNRPVLVVFQPDELIFAPSAKPILVLCSLSPLMLM